MVLCSKLTVSEKSSNRAFVFGYASLRRVMFPARELKMTEAYEAVAGLRSPETSAALSLLSESANYRHQLVSLAL